MKTNALVAAPARKVTLRISFDTLIEEIRAILERDGFVISGVADFQRDLLDRLNVHSGKNVVLVVHHPQLTMEMLSIARRGGEVLPCHITLEEHYPGNVELFVFNPVAVLALRSGDLPLKAKADEMSRRLDLLLRGIRHDRVDEPDLVTSWS